MELCTKGLLDNNIYVVYLLIDQKSDLSPNINDGDNFKLLLIKSGELHLKVENEILHVCAPAMILLSNVDNLQVISKEKLSSLTIYFKPTVIHDQFTYHNIYTKNYDAMGGTTMFQDYGLIKPFFPCRGIRNKIYSLKISSLVTIQNLVDHIDQQFNNQGDSYWPCRSRSYFMELLYFVNYSCIQEHEMKTEHSFVDPSVEEIMHYLHEHIEDIITLPDLTQKFHINRNQLNSLFKEKTSMTCLGYLMSIRIELSKIMLSQTFLPINEIGQRVGFLDTNYFTKVFKKNTGKTPSAYRKEPTP